jgi:spore germination protein GerM
MGSVMRVAFVVAVLGGGLSARSLLRPHDSAWLAGWWSWTRPTVVSLYFSDGRFLVPVSRRLPSSEKAPEAVLAALLEGPRRESGLESAIPRGVRVRSVSIDQGHADIELIASGESLDPAAATAIIDSITALPTVDAVTLRVDGRVVTSRAQRVPLLYYASAHGLAAVADPARTPRDAIAAYLKGPQDPGLTGFPPDVRLLTYRENEGRGLVSLEMTYTPSLRRLAIERPDTMRFLLLAVIATLTDFPGVRAVMLDFQGHTRLGLGQCSDLLGVPQARPQMLNDERLLVSTPGHPSR